MSGSLHYITAYLFDDLSSRLRMLRGSLHDSLVTTYLQDLRGMLRSSPRLRMLRGSQHTMKRRRVASSMWVLRTLRLSALIIIMMMIMIIMMIRIMIMRSMWVLHMLRLSALIK